MGNAQWIAQTSGSSNFLTSIFFATPTTGYVADGTGYIIKTTDGGSNWNTVGGASQAYSSLFFTSIDTGYCVGLAGDVLKTVNGGFTWIDNYTSVNDDAFSLHFPSTNIGYALCWNLSDDSIIVYKTINAGTNWSKISSFPSIGIPSSIFFKNTMTGYMVLNSDGIYKTSDGGFTWTPKVADPDLNSLFFPSISVGYAVGLGGIYKSIDAGNTWTIQPNPNPTAFYSVFFVDDNNGYAVGGDGFSTGVIVKTTNGGTIWTLSLTNSYTYNSLHFPDANTGYTCGQGGAILKIAIPVTIEGISNSDSLCIYPNPASTVINFSISGTGSLPSTLHLYDVTGKDVKSFSTSEREFTMERGSIASGIYFVQIVSEGQVLTKKIILE